MTKARERIVSDSSQMGLFDLLRQERDERAATAPGRMNVSARLQASTRAAIKNAPKSREAVADEMSELTGLAITVHQVNNWTAESHPHRIPAELLPAFCQATGNIEPLRILAEAAGVFTLPGPDALRAEIQKLDEDVKRLHREKQKRLLFLKELEG
ncbi:MAG: hypothetical protein A2Y38_15545 [Spirochaetes bacterium GWB1_59_5]|nr:MAG: hypothetical protein A2Y38_15545 [Spirochaetes bacterium GWB1_59_5]